MALFVALGILMSIWPVWAVLSLYMNYKRVRQLGLTIVISPIGVMSLSVGAFSSTTATLAPPVAVGPG